LKKVISFLLSFAALVAFSGCSADPNAISIEDGKKGIRSLFYDYRQACDLSVANCLDFYKEHNHPDIYNFSQPEVIELLGNLDQRWGNYGTPDLATVDYDREWLYPESLSCDPVNISLGKPPRGTVFIVTSDGEDVHVAYLDGKFHFFQSLVISCD
jgi:hypothetical protein